MIDKLYKLYKDNNLNNTADVLNKIKDLMNYGVPYGDFNTKAEYSQAVDCVIQLIMGARDRELATLSD